MKRVVPLFLLLLSPLVVHAEDCFEQRSCNVYNMDNRVDPPKKIKMKCIRVSFAPSPLYGGPPRDKCYCVFPDAPISAPSGATLIDDYGLLNASESEKRICKSNNSVSPPTSLPGLPPVDPPGGGIGVGIDGDGNGLR